MTKRTPWRWSLGSAKNVQKSWYTKTTLRHTWWDLKGSQKVIRWLSRPILHHPKQPNARGGPDASGSPMGVTFWPENENLCGNPTFWAILILWKKKFGHLWFFWLCLVKIAHFWTILTKTCFCSNDLHLWTKVVQKYVLNWV